MSAPVARRKTPSLSARVPGFARTALPYSDRRCCTRVLSARILHTRTDTTTVGRRYTVTGMRSYNFLAHFRITPLDMPHRGAMLWV